MPWFGDHSHMDVGYSSQDPGSSASRFQQARRMGISAFVVDWYGESRPYSDHNFALLASRPPARVIFRSLCCTTKSEDEDMQATDAAIAALDKAYNAYIGPAARYHDAYLTYDGRPLFFVFPRADTSTGIASASIAELGASPTSDLQGRAACAVCRRFRGVLCLGSAGPGGMGAGRKQLGAAIFEEFLQNHEEQASRQDRGWRRLARFRRSAAKWGLNRHIQRNCGKTLDETLSLYRDYYDSANPLPFLMIETWNDYEEGTAIERPSTAGCSGHENVASAVAPH